MDKGSVKCNQPSRENCNKKKKNKERPKRATEDKEEF